MGDTGDIDEEFRLSEAQINQQVDSLLWDVLVRGHSSGFGLTWRTGSTEFFETVLGSWLNRVDKVKVAGGLSKALKTTLSFFIVDDEEQELRQNLNVSETQEDNGSNARIKFSTIDYVHVEVKEKPYRVTFTVSSDTANELLAKEWTLTPVQDNDAEVVINWVACLRHRAGLLSDKLLLARNNAMVAVLFTQSHWRRKKALKKYKRRLERRQGVVNILSSTVNAWFFGGDGYVDSDDSDNEEKATTVQPNNISSIPLVSVVSAMMQDFYKAPIKGRSFSDVKTEVSTKYVGAGTTVEIPHQNRISVAPRLQTKYNLPDIQAGEIEIEAFEYQKWEIRHKRWSKGFFADRLCKEKKKTLDELSFTYQDPSIWERKANFELDLSGLNSRGCGKDGWVYSGSLRGLVLDKAFDKVSIKPSTSMTFRRRRWFQRRRNLKTGKKKVDNPVIWHGYLGKKSNTSGRWEVFYFAIMSGLVRNNRMSGISIVQFKQHVVNYYALVNAESEEFYSKWSSFKEDKDFKIFNIEGGSVQLGKRTKANPNGKHTMNIKLSQFPSGFSSVSKAPQQKTKALELCCESRKLQRVWFKVLVNLIRKQDKNFTLTRIKIEKHQAVMSGPVKSYDNIPTFTWLVLNRIVPTDIESFVLLVFYDSKFETNLHNKLSSRDFRVVQPWTDGFKPGSRKEVRYFLPKQKNNASEIGVGTIPRTQVIEKFKIESYDVGKGLHMTSSLKFADLPFGNLFQCLIRTVVSVWKEGSARISVSMQIDLRSKDQNIESYIESLMRAYMLQYYIETWMPLVGKAIKFTRDHQRKHKKTDYQLITPTGLKYVE